MIPAAYDFPACALCGSNDRTVVYAGVHDLQYGLPGEFSIVRCVNCHLYYLWPRPSEQSLAGYYPADYAPYTGNANAIGRSFDAYKILSQVAALPYRLVFGHETTTIEPFGQRRMLDVGCGAGEYLQDMQQLGWTVHGVDASDVAIQAAGQRVGVSHVWTGTLDTLDPTLNELDLITFMHCLEHVPDPEQTIKEAYRRLRVGGKIKIAVPDVSSPEAKLFGRHWIGWDVPRHLMDFSLVTLTQLLQHSGLTFESSRPQFMPWTFGASFDRMVESTLHIKWRGLGHRIIHGVLYPTTAISYVVGNRACIEVVARKRS